MYNIKYFSKLQKFQISRLYPQYGIHPETFSVNAAGYWVLVLRSRAKSAIWYWLLLGPNWFSEPNQYCWQGQISHLELTAFGAELVLRAKSENSGVDSENLGSKSVPSRSVLVHLLQNSPIVVKSALIILGPIWLLESNQLFSFYSVAQLQKYYCFDNKKYC